VAGFPANDKPIASFAVRVAADQRGEREEAYGNSDKRRTNPGWYRMLLTVRTKVSIALKITFSSI